MDCALPNGVAVTRHPVSFLSDVVYSLQPMPRALAETICTLRREHGLSYVEFMWALAQSDPDAGQCYGLGKALTEAASMELQDDDPAWR